MLTRHFFASLFDFGFLSDDGAESLKRALLGSLAVAIAVGLLLVRVFMAKYSELLGRSRPRPIASAVVADHAFLMAVPMWIVAAAIGLVGESLFPDEMDFRILMAEPLSRSTIFGAKLAALLLFAGLFVAGAHVGLLPLAALTMIGAVRTGAFVTDGDGVRRVERSRKPFRRAGDRGGPRRARAVCAARAAAGVLGAVRSW